MLGRAAECDVQLDSLKHLTMVSRRHCRIRAKRGVPNAWTVEDLGGANGTAVNGKRLCASKRVCVSSGDRIVLGSRGLSEAVYCIEVRGGAEAKNVTSERQHASVPAYQARGVVPNYRWYRWYLGGIIDST